MKLKVTIHEAPVVQLYQVLHFDENGKFGAARPEINRLDPFDLTLLTSAWQWFWYGLMVEECAGQKTEAQLKQAWKSLTGGDKVIMNGRGTDTCADYVSGENLKSMLPAYYPLVFGGAVLAGNETVNKGVRELEVEHLDGTNDPPFGVTRKTHPHLISLGTVWTGHQVNGVYQVDPFPQLLPFGSPFMVLASEYVTYPLEALRKLALGASVPGPYR